ncbi:MAG TPA: class I SAM-dependent methyltransferase [Spirochaetia bacterium]
MKPDIKRGLLFETCALDYDQYRPGYPKAVVSEAIALAGLRSSSRLLEIGCGTGKATVSFAAHGYTMDCVDPGRKLIGFARRSCRDWPHVSFYVGRFEDVPLPVENYDMVLSAQAFHWIEPRGRAERVARVLRRGGSLVLLQNYPGKDVDPAIERLSAAIRAESGGAMERWDYFDTVASLKRELERCPMLDGVSVARHRWAQRYSAEGYAGLFRTYSDYLSLPRKVQLRIARRIREIVEENGGHVMRSYDTILLHARRR